MAAAPAWATGTLDQSNLTSIGGGWFVEPAASIGQTFTVGLTGTLTDVAVQVEEFSGSSPLNVEITRLSGGLPDLSQVVGSGQILSPGAVTPTLAWSRSSSPRRQR